MADDNGKFPVPLLEIRIIYNPANGGLQVSMPPCDDVLRLGMLEFAKVTLIEARFKNQQGCIELPNLTLKPGMKLT